MSTTEDKETKTTPSARGTKLIGGSIDSGQRLTKIESQMENVASKGDVKRIDAALLGLATKSDVERTAKKSDIEKIPTKSDIERFATKSDLERFASKSDIEKLVTKSDMEKYATKSDTEKLASKSDLEKIEAGTASKTDIERIDTTMKHVATKAETASLRVWVIIATILVAILVVLKIIELF